MRFIEVVRPNRTNKCPFKSNSQLSSRGDFDYFSDSQALFVKRNNNNFVIGGTNFAWINLLQSVTRFSKGARSPVQMPNIFHLYNQKMGGVDNTNRLVADLRPTILVKNGTFHFGLIFCLFCVWLLGVYTLIYNPVEGQKWISWNLPERLSNRCSQRTNLALKVDHLDLN